MKKLTRRRWLVIVIVLVAAAAAAAAAYLLVVRDSATGVHYLTSKAATGTIAQTVQADFTLADSRDAMTISLSGTGSSSSAASGNGGAATTSAARTGAAITTVSAILTPAVILDSVATTRAAVRAALSTPALTSFTPASGPVGTSVTVTGSGLSGASAVSFNGQAAFFKVVSDSELVAIVPAGATSGPIAVTTTDGTAMSAVSFSVTPSPKPTPSRTATASPRPAATGSAAGGSSSSSRSGTNLTASSGSSSAASSSSASGSSGTSGVVTRIVLPAGAAPRTLQRLLVVSGKPIYAFVSPTPLYETLSTSLSAGNDRANVAALQRALKAGGYFSGTVTGDFGPTTKTALEAWQSAQGLSQTGEITTASFVWVPTGATIESWNVVLGGSVSSSTALATVDFPRALVAQALVTQADVSSLKVGQKAALTIDGKSGTAFTATIVSIASQPASSSSSGSSSTTAQYTVDLAPASLPALAKSGMTGSLTVIIAKRSNVLVVPTSAVSGTSSASFVRVMMDGAVNYRQVTTGMATSSLTQVTSGLTAGEVVVTGTYTNSASSSTSTGTSGGLGGLTGGGTFRRSSGGSFNGFPAPGQ